MNRDQVRPDRRSDHPSDQPVGTDVDRSRPLAPGDEAAPGTPGTGANICRRCGGKGKVNAETCPECQGSGTVIEGIGGA